MLFDSIEERFSTPFWAGSSICGVFQFHLKISDRFQTRETR